ncbi:class I SAM-dependent methyltransferase [Candidatus Woesearchaeota archaeon]|nr:class I SAM-dependent methyltransferase [Candidatus Woesearchaeota archaeon]
MRPQQEYWDKVWQERDWCIASNFGYGLLDDSDPEFLVGKDVLDVGCGNSEYSSIPDNTKMFIGVDISGVALRKIKRESTRGGLLQASALALPLGDNVVDYSVCFEALPLFGEHCGVALAEMARVSREGLLFTVSHPDHKLALGNHSPRDLPFGKLFTGTAVSVTAFTESEISTLVTSLGMHLETLAIYTFNQVMNYGVPVRQQTAYVHGNEKEAMYVKAVHPKV